MKYFFMGLSGAFKINERLTLGAFDRNQVKWLLPCNEWYTTLEIQKGSLWVIWSD